MTRAPERYHAQKKKKIPVVERTYKVVPEVDSIPPLIFETRLEEIQTRLLILFKRVFDEVGSCTSNLNRLAASVADLELEVESRRLKTEERKCEAERARVLYRESVLHAGDR